MYRDGMGWKGREGLGEGKRGEEKARAEESEGQKRRGIGEK